MPTVHAKNGRTRLIDELSAETRLFVKVQAREMRSAATQNRWADSLRQSTGEYNFASPCWATSCCLALEYWLYGSQRPLGHFQRPHHLAKRYRLMHISPWQDSVPKLAQVMLALSAMRPDNTLRQRGALNFHIPAETYGHAKTGHPAIQHHEVDAVIQVKTGG